MLMSFDNAVSISNKSQVIIKGMPGLEFTAPEVFLSKYNRKLDEYSAGVVMYYIFSGFNFPFKISAQSSDQEQYWSLMN